MKKALFFNNALNNDHFRVDYPYFGLFGTAEVTPVRDHNETMFECKLLNGSKVLLKKQFQSEKWVDASTNAETPLSSTIGLSIEDFLKIKEGL